MNTQEQRSDGIPERLSSVQARIAEACRLADRDPKEVTLIAVGKAQPDGRIAAALAAGQRIFGENYVQESQARWPPFRRDHSELEIHMIGALQSNKARDAVALFDVIQTLDRPRLARALAKELAKQDRRPRMFIQLNTGNEPQKAGIGTDELAGFVALCRDQLDLPVEGLMAIPPADEDVAPHAALLVKLAKRHDLRAVSIGMSADFETAIRFGATHVRVGTEIFGRRPAKRS